MMHNRRKVPLLGPYLLLLLAGCATTMPHMNLLLTSLSQEREGSGIVWVLSGLVDIDELPDATRQKLIANGYEAGSLVPARCRTSGQGKDSPGRFHILKKPESTDADDWWYIGPFRFEMFQTMEEWAQRNAPDTVGQRGDRAGVSGQPRTSIEVERAPDPEEPGEVFRDCEVCPEMVVIPAGSFTMGSPADDRYADRNEGPAHQVDVRAFAMGRHEVTVGEFRTYARGNVPGWRPADGQADSHPAVSVSWRDAKGYALWLSSRTRKEYRLPSEAEWEYAARAGSTERYFWGDDLEAREACRYANVWDDRANCDDGFDEAAPVGSFEPNAFGLHDMLGNVNEFTEDCWHDNYEGAPGDASAWTSGGTCEDRVIRGGCHGSTLGGLRSAWRQSFGVTLAGPYHGFRVVRTLGS